VNLTNTAFPVLGTNYGPGYVTFAPEATRVITLSNVWSGQGGFVVTGPGQVILAGANTYTGNTTVSGGELSLSGGGAIASPIIVANGATFDVSGLTSTFALASGQTLSNSSSTAILNGSAGSGSGTISLTYASGTPSFTVANGTLTLSAGTVFNVNNTGSALGPGTYTLIGTSGGGVVVGPVPSSYVVGGNGVSGTSLLQISTSNTLDLVVVASADQAPVIGNSVTNTVTSGSMWQIAISSLSNSAAWSDPNSDTVTLSSVGPSANAVSVTNDANNIYYTKPVTASDNFSYIVTDATTLTATGMVYLVVTPAVSSIISGPAVNGSGNPTFSGTGASVNCVYGVESTTSLSGSPVWIEAGTTTTDGTGAWSFTDIGQTNPPTIFYRLYNPDDPGSPPQ
jgi:autotransporter-associated beta strand protein